MSELYDSDTVLLQDSLNEQLYDSAGAPATNINPVINLSGQAKTNIQIDGMENQNIYLAGEAKKNIALSGNIDEPKE